MINGGFSMISSADAYEKSLAQLDHSQLVAVNSTADKIVIKAPAGSGKTRVLISAISAYRYNYVNDRICAITYTRAARAEMENRLRSLGVTDVEVTTIHVWARNQLENLSIKYDFKIRILEESQIKIILSQLIAEHIKHSAVKAVNLNILYTYITGSKKMDITDNYRRTLNALERKYIEYKRDNVLYDFTDYPLYLYDVLKTYNETIKGIDALFVDEFQDVDEIQLQVFNLVEAKKKFYIGDKRQSIYMFRGACGRVFEALEDFQVFKLDTNYRSYQEIINYATSVYVNLCTKVITGEETYITSVTESHQSPVYCNRKYGGQVTTIDPYGVVRHFGINNANFDALDVVAEFIKKEPMILCRTNKQVKMIREELGYYNVDTVHQAKGLEYKDVVVIDATISDIEDLNIAYVAMTRAEDNLLIINWAQFLRLFEKVLSKNLMFNDKNNII